MRAVALILATGAVLMTANTATAYPTEVDTGELRDKRLATIRWYRQEARLERQRESRGEGGAPDPGSAPAASPAVSYPSGVLTASQVAAYARGAGFPEGVIETMVAIAWRESKFCPSAVNGYGCNEGGTVHGTNACGLFQIYKCPGPEALNPATNAALAYAKYQARGLSPWGG